jgi:hypothetical protein
MVECFFSWLDPLCLNVKIRLFFPDQYVGDMDRDGFGFTYFEVFMPRR